MDIKTISKKEIFQKTPNWPNEYINIIPKKMKLVILIFKIINTNIIVNKITPCVDKNSKK